jgi:hypothetical protein
LRDLPQSFRRHRADVKHASDLANLVKQYHWLSQEIEWQKHLVLGVQSYTIDSRRWKAWKQKQARKKGLDLNCSPLSELSDDPHFRRLVELHERLMDAHDEIQGYYDSHLAEQTLLHEVTSSFPALRKRMQPPALQEIVLHQILSEGKGIDPQAYFAALFVRTLQHLGRVRPKSAPTFFIDQAFAAWDDRHKRAFAHWISLPYFPDREFRQLSVNPPSV